MKIFKKSIVRRLFIDLLLFGVLVAAVVFYLYRSEMESVPFYVLPLVLGLFTLFFLVVYFWDIARPLKKILTQMQSLLVGKPYRKIYTDRIDEIGVLAFFFNKVTEGLGEASSDIVDRERMLEELTVASQLQRDILPKNNPQLSGLQIVAKTRPASELGGDSFSFINRKGKTYVYVGDVTGHGAAAGIIMTMVSSLINVFADFYDNTYDIVVNVNKYLKKWVKKAMYMTMVMLCWDEKSKKMTYVGAGHEHIIIYRAATGKTETILSGGVALGMVEDNSKLVIEKDIALGDGDVVILYSDGIIEARNDAGELFGLPRLVDAVEEYAGQYSSEGINMHIAKDVSKYMGNHEQDDDMTLIVVKRDKSTD